MIAKFFDALPLSDNLKIVAKNFSSMAALQLLINLLPFITIPYLMRVIGPSNYGLLAFVQAFIFYFAIVLDYGFSYSSLREISIFKKDAQKVSEVVNAVLSLKLIFLFLIFWVVVGACFFSERFHAHWHLYLFYFFFLAGSALNPLFLYQGMEKMKYVLYLSLPSALSTVLIFVFIKKEQDYALVPLIGMIFSIISAILGLSIAYKKFGLKASWPSPAQMAYELKHGWSIFVSNFFCVGHTNFRIFMLGLFWGNAVTGYYKVGEMLMSLMLLFPHGIFFSVFYPRLCEIYHQNKQYAISMTRKLQWLLNIVYILIFLVCFVYSREIVRFVCGSFSYESMVSFRLLMVAVIVNVLIFGRNMLLFISGRRDTVAKVGIIGGVIGTVIGLPLIYYFSYTGAALSIILVNIINTGIIFFITRKCKDFGVS